MIIFNTTFHLDDEVHQKGILFLKEVYIKKAVDSGFLLEPRLARIYKQHEENGVSYALQFKVKNIEVLNHWMSTGDRELQDELKTRFGNKILGFVTLLEEVEL